MIVPNRRNLAPLILAVAAIFSDPIDAFTTLSPISQKSSIILINNSRMDSIKMSGNDNNSDFWEKQKTLAKSMNDSMDIQEGKTPPLSEKEKYNKKVNSLVSENFYFSVMLFSAIWFVVPNPLTAISYLLGALLGTAYCYGLGKYVATLGGSAYDAEDVKGSGIGSGRFAFLILLFIFVGKFKSEGLQEIPAIMGFFTYQIASLSQGLKEAAD